MRRYVIQCNICGEEINQKPERGGWRLSRWCWTQLNDSFWPHRERCDICNHCVDRICRAIFDGHVEVGR